MILDDAFSFVVNERVSTLLEILDETPLHLVAYGCRLFQPFLRFWDYEPGTLLEAESSGSVSTLLEILVLLPIARAHPFEVRLFQPFLRFWQTKPVYAYTQHTATMFQPFLRFWALKEEKP